MFYWSALKRMGTAKPSASCPVDDGFLGLAVSEAAVNLRYMMPDRLMDAAVNARKCHAQLCAPARQCIM